MLENKIKLLLTEQNKRVKDLCTYIEVSDAGLRKMFARDSCETKTLLRIAEFFNVKVWPEAAALIERYRGERALLCIADRYQSSRNYTQHINDGLKRLIYQPPFNELSTNWARHTYATLAFNELDASRDDVSAALGHKYGSEITAVYINPDIRKVDELNRRMLDLVFSDD